MPRTALFALVVAFILSGSLQAQRTTTAFHGYAARSPGRSGFGGRHGMPNRFSRHHTHFHHNDFGAGFAPSFVPWDEQYLPPYGEAYFPPYDEPYEYEQPDTEAVTNEPAPPVVIPRTPEAPIPKAQVIEIPGSANSTAAKMPPPTVFILANGERLETRRFVLTVSDLSFSLGRRQRTIPLDMIDVDATTAANRERGIDLRIPADRNEISLSF